MPLRLELEDVCYCFAFQELFCVAQVANTTLTGRAQGGFYVYDDAEFLTVMSATYYSSSMQFNSALYGNIGLTFPGNMTTKTCVSVLNQTPLQHRLRV